MGQSQETNYENRNIKNINQEISINELLDQVIEKDIKLRKKRRLCEKGKTSKRKKSNCSSEENSLEEQDEENSQKDISLKSITELVDSIYTKNINFQMKHRANKSLYESIFDIRNMTDFKEDLDNNEYNIKSCKVMKDIMFPEKPKKSPQKDLEKNKEAINESNNDDNINIEKDFFKKWDYRDDIFENIIIEPDLKHIESDEKSEEMQDKNKSEIKEEIKDNEKIENVEEKNIKMETIKNSVIQNNDIDNNILKSNNIDNESKKNLSYDNIVYVKKNINNNKNNFNNLNKNNIKNNNNSIIIKNDINDMDNINKLKKNNINTSQLEKSIENISNIKFNKDNNSSSYMNPSIFDKDEKFIIIENNEKNEEKENEKEKIVNKNIDTEKKQSERPTKTNNSKYFKDSSDSNEEFILGENTKRELLNKSHSEDSEISSIIYNVNENKSENDDEEINLHFKYKKKIPIKETKKTINSEQNTKGINNINNNKINNKNNNNNIQININKNNFNSTNKNNIYNNNHKKNINNNNRKNYFNDINPNSKDDNFDINNYYSDNLYKKKSPIISRIRNRRVDYRKVMIDKGVGTDELNQKNIKNIKPKIYISKTPEKQIKPINKISKKIIINPNDNNNNNNYTATIKSQDYSKFKLNYDINDINKTIKKIEEQIKSIEKYDKQVKNTIINDNKIINNIHHIPIKQINNYKYKPEKNLTPVHYKRKINKKDKLMSNKTFDENDIKSYKDIMMEINNERRKKNEKYKVTREGKYIYIGAKTPEIKLRKKKVKKKGKKKNINNNLNNFKNEENSLKKGFTQNRPAWK